MPATTQKSASRSSESSQSVADAPRWQRMAPWLAAALVALVTLLVFGRVIGFDFLGRDDPDNILLNPQLNPPSLRHVARFWREPYLGLYIPATYTFWSAEALLAWPAGEAPRRGARVAFDPRVFHAGSVLLHAACAVLVFVIARRLTQSDLAACLGALLFALHPLQVESVGWVTENKGLLSASLGLAALWQYLRFVEAGRDASGRHGKRKHARGSGGKWWHYAAATVAFGLALLSKPSVAALPVIAALLARYFLDRPWREIAPPLALWFAMAAAALLVTRGAQSGSAITFEPPAIAMRPFIAADAISFYLRKLIWPVWLCPDYGRGVTELARGKTVWISWLLPAALLALVAWLPNRRQWLALLLVSLAALAPVLGLVPFAYQSVSTVADRYMYLAMLGPALALAWLVARSPRRALVGGVGAMLGMLAVLSFDQTAVWRNGRAWTDFTLAANPRSVYAREDRAQQFERAGQRESALAERRQSALENPLVVEPLFYLATALTAAGRLDEAASCYEQALSLAPNSRIVPAFLAEVHLKGGRHVDAVALFRRAVLGAARDRNLSAQATRLGAEWMNRGQLAEANEAFTAAIRLNPRSVEAENDLAVALLRQGDARQALLHCDRALAIDSEHPVTLANRGVLLDTLGRRAEAIASLRKALAIDPYSIDAANNLAISLLRDGKPAEAVAVYTAALGRQPQWREGARRLAWIWATAADANLRNGKEAVTLAHRLCVATNFDDALALDALAAARADQGDFAGATEAAQRAVGLLAQPQNARRLAAIEARLALYHKGQLYREPAGASLLPPN
ncbi:MAG: tetratricopeptide repeat protein [Pirellulales bacterium]|nr:tetratricopeptide repeat protein [Pirellulales bacterium]